MRKMRMLVHKNLAAVCCAIMFAFGLAACSSSSNNKTVVTEAEKTINTARTGAMSAATAAKTASDNAKEAVDEADAAVMAVAPIFTMTGGDDGTVNLAGLVKEGRDAAGMAEEYNQETKMESDKAAAAETVTAAADARAKAELAQEKAEAQARIAAEKAKMATDAAAKGIKVSGDTDMARTYGFGDTSITPAALPKKNSDTSVVNGKTVTKTTGLIGTADGHAPMVDVAAVMYLAKSGSTPERKAKPAIEKRTFTFAKAYDSADDGSRLWLATQYAAGRAVHTFRDTSGSLDLEKTDDATWGAHDHDSDSSTAKLKVMKATGMFYMASGSGAFDQTNPSSATIEDETKVNKDIFYYQHPTEGKKWLRRTQSVTPTGEATTHTYMNVSVVENVMGFPVATDYIHVNYGIWIGNLKADGDDSDADLTELGTGFASAKAGKGMTGEMPDSGTGTYKGSYLVSYRKAHADGNGSLMSSANHSTVTADFAKATVMVDLHSLAKLEGTIAGDRFSGTKVSSVTGMVGETAVLTASADGSGYTGSFSGGFFGPQAAEVGGVFSYTSKDKKNGEFRGSFGGAK